jgi:hypothetical protein
MPMGREIACVVLAPLLVAGIIAGIARWRRWPWAMPIAAGAGFLLGYGLVRLPSLPPVDGIDWLFWLAIPLVLLGAIHAIWGKRWGWVLGAMSGIVSFVIIHPIVPGAVSPAMCWGSSLALAAGGAMLMLAIEEAEERIGSAAILAGLCIIIGGTAVVIISSNLLVFGFDGIAAAAALAPLVVLAGRFRIGRSVAVAFVPILAGLLVGGHFYPDPGVSWTNFIVLFASPLLLLVELAIPGNRKRIRGAVALAAVAIAVAVIAIPTAIAAKKAADADPYVGYYK